MGWCDAMSETDLTHLHENADREVYYYNLPRYGMSMIQSINSEIDLGNLDEHDSIKQGFAHVLNVVEPEHKYIIQTALYPITPDEINYSYKKSTSSYYASCGPRRDRANPVFFAADRTAFQEKTAERVLAIYVHELTHLKIGSHSNYQAGAHPPIFWREFGFNAHKAIENWGELESRFGSLSKEAFIGYIVSEEVNRFNIDRRYHDVRTVRQQMAKWFESTLK